MIFPKISGAIYRLTKVKIFLIPFSMTFLNPKILGFFLLRKHSVTWGLKYEKLMFRKL